MLWPAKVTLSTVCSRVFAVCALAVASNGRLGQQQAASGELQSFKLQSCERPLGSQPIARLDKSQTRLRVLPANERAKLSTGTRPPSHFRSRQTAIAKRASRLVGLAIVWPAWLSSGRLGLARRPSGDRVAGRRRRPSDSSRVTGLFAP